MADKHFFNKIVLQKQKRKGEDKDEEDEKEEGENVELTLGLSLNGKFGVDPRKGSNKLKRSCSAITTFDETMRFELDPSAPSWVGGGLARTCSLPVVEEEESRKRKELQTIRRREAKRRLSEKLRSCGAAAATNEEVEEEEEEERDGSLPRMVSQGSSGSSGLSEFESQTTLSNNGMNKATEAKSPQSVQSFSEQKIANQDVKPPRSISAPNEMAKNVLADMPCVFTKGDGPNGKRVDGFLYRYKKGEEVRIVCVCHGTFLTPAEFIKHAGGGDVEHPLRHIVVNPTPFM